MISEPIQAEFSKVTKAFQKTFVLTTEDMLLVLLEQAKMYGRGLIIKKLENIEAVDNEKKN